MQEYNDKIVQLRQGLETAFVDGSQVSNLAYKPEFLSNNYKEGRKVLSSLEDELLACDEFCFSVAFITMGGIAPLLQTLKELEAKNVRGRIITTDYLNFSEPKALKKLAEYKNISLKMFCVKDGSEGFHTKGYIFKNEDMYRIVVGSSNMTMSALTKNREWNTKIVSTEQGEYAKRIVDEFEELWSSSAAVDYNQFIESYSIKYNAIKKQKIIAAQAEIPSIEEYILKPNAMQVGFIQNLQKIRERGENRALLISATGERDILMTSERNLEFTRFFAA